MEHLLDSDIRVADLPSFSDESVTPESPDEIPVVEIATALLELIPSMSRVRFRLVPVEMSEDEFWVRMFGLLRVRVLATLHE